MVHRIHPVPLLSILLLSACPKTPVEVGALATVGARCDLVDGGISPSQGVVSTAAPECTSGVCIKPVVTSTGTATADTSPLCTIECSTDDDCEEGQLRNPDDPADKGCVSGFTCGVAFVKGPMCCKKVCMCKDFTGGPVETPIACQGAGAATCQATDEETSGDARLGDDGRTPAASSCVDGRDVPEGAIYGDACLCCQCSSAGGVCSPTDCFPSKERPGPPPESISCESDAECKSALSGSAVCFFDQGCTSPRGVCVDKPGCGLSTTTDYCGCDGKTYRVGSTPDAVPYPNRPYAHLGACP